MRLYKIIIFVCFISIPTYGQIKLDSLFRVFNIKELKLDLTNVSTTKNYTANMGAKANFYLDKTTSNPNVQLIIYHIQTLGNFSVFGITDCETLKYSKEKSVDDAHGFILYDVMLERSYMVEFSSFGGAPIEKIAPNKIEVLGLSGQLGRIASLDANLKPISCLKAGDFDEGVFQSLERYSDSGDKKSVKDITSEKLSLKNLSYNDIIKLLDTPIETDYTKKIKSSDSYVIYHFKVIE